MPALYAATWKPRAALAMLIVAAAAAVMCSNGSGDGATVIPRLGSVELPAGFGVLDVVGADGADPFDGYCVGPAATLTPNCDGSRDVSWMVLPPDGPLPPLVPSTDLDDALEWARDRYGKNGFTLHRAERVTVSGRNAAHWRVIFGEDSMRTVILVTISEDETLVITAHMPLDEMPVSDQDALFDSVLATLRIERS